MFYPSFTDDVINGIVQDKRAGRDDHTIAKKYLVDRCYVHNILFDAGIYKTRVWTKEEVQYLKDSYPSGDMKDIRSNLKRSVACIQAEANKLGLHREDVKYAIWSKRDLDLIVKYYAEIGAEQLHDVYLPEKVFLL